MPNIGPLGHQRRDRDAVPVRERDALAGSRSRDDPDRIALSASPSSIARSSDVREVAVLCSSSSPRGGVPQRRTASSTASSHFGQFPGELDRGPARRARLRRRGGTNNLVVSQLDPRQGLRHGQVRAADRLPDHRPGGGRAVRPGLRVPTRRREHGRWRVWWRAANIEQFVSFFVIGAITITVFSLVAHSTVFGQPRRSRTATSPSSRSRARRSSSRSAPWFGTLFWLIGAISLFAAALGIIDYVSRLVADVLTRRLLADSAPLDREPALLRRRLGDHRLRRRSCCSLGFDQPLTLVVFAAALSGVVMFIYSGLLIVHQPALHARAAARSAASASSRSSGPSASSACCR